MSKFNKHKEEKIEVPKKVFPKEQLEKLNRALNKYGLEKFLIRKRAIRVDEKGVWTIVVYEGLILEMRKSGMGNDEYHTDVPYVYWQEAIEQLNIMQSRDKFAEKRKLEGLAKIAEEMNINN